MLKKTLINIFLLPTAAYAFDDIRELDLHKPVYYHKEVILMSPAKQFGGLYIQIEDAPLSLARPLFYAPKAKTRRIKNMADNLTENVLPTTSVFGFLQQANLNR